MESMTHNKYNKEVFAAMAEIEFDENEQDLFDSWTKEQIYVAYLVASCEIDKLQHQINEYERKLAKIRFNLKNIMD